MAKQPLVLNSVACPRFYNHLFKLLTYSNSRVSSNNVGSRNGGTSTLPARNSDRFATQGVAVWVALSRRSNGMTSRSVISPAEGTIRTTEVCA